MLQPEVNPNVLMTRQWDFPVKLYYAQMRAVREQGVWDNGVIDIGSSIETDKSERSPINALIRESQRESIEAEDYTNYASSYGILDLRAALVEFYGRLGCSDIEMHSQVMVTGGTIDAVSRVIRSLNTRAIVIPSWAPFFARSHALLQGLEIIDASFNLTDGAYDLEQLDCNLRDKGIQPGKALMYIAHPASPVGTVMDDAFVEKEFIPYLTEKGIWIMADSTVYSTRFDGVPIRPMVSYPGFMDIGVESVTLSKEFGLPGIRIGGLVGNKDIINAVRMLAGTEVDILPAAEQRIATKALQRLEPRSVERRIAQELHTETLPRLAAMGWPVVVPHAGVDMVLEVPSKYRESGFQDPSLLTSFSLLRRYGVGLCPGSVFGADGKNYLRLGLKQSKGKVSHALDSMRMQGFDWYTDEPSSEDISYLEDKICNLDVTRL